MWGKSKNKSKPTNKSSHTNKAKLDTMIGPNTEIHGDVKFENFLVIDGVINGNVTADEDSNSRLALNKTGRVVGDINVPNIYIDGCVEGDVYASGKVELANSAQIKGNVYYNLLEMAMGAALNGSLLHRPAGEVRLIEHKDKKAHSTHQSAPKVDSKNEQK